MDLQAERLKLMTLRRLSRTQPTMLKELQGRKDNLSFENLVSRSTIEAEEFRRSLIQEDAEPNRATLISKACISFRDAINHRAVKQRANQQTASASYDLSRFQLDQQGIYKSIEGTREISKPSQFYGAFEGKWFGIWDRNNVDHHWGEFIFLNPVRSFGMTNGEPVRLLGYQYAWVGDGYGLNQLASSPDGSKTFLLGYIVHVRDGDINQEVIRRPHVGVIDGANRLIWITKSEIFFEEMMPGNTRRAGSVFYHGVQVFDQRSEAGWQERVPSGLCAQFRDSQTMARIRD